MTPLLLTANSPGEVSGWALPLAQQWFEQTGEKSQIILLPCTFATGSEAQVTAQSPYIERTYTTKELLRLYLFGAKKLRGYPLVHLGGDLMYTALYQALWKNPCWSYRWSRRWWNPFFRGYFAHNEDNRQLLLKRKAPSNQIHIVGDLMVDATYRLADPRQITKKELKITFLPGSRHHELKALTPFFAQVAYHLKKSHPQAEFHLNLSPYITDLEGCLTSPPHPKVGGDQCFYDPDAMTLTSEKGLTIKLHQKAKASLCSLAESQLAISVPGTKTGQAGALGVPALTLVPLNKPEWLPALGPLALLDWVPGGEKIKGSLLLKTKEKLGFVSQPNLLRKTLTVPEMVEVLTPLEVADQALQWLDDRERLEATEKILLKSYEPLQGAARKIVDQILKDLEG